MQTVFDTKQEMQDYAKQVIDAYNKIKGTEHKFDCVIYNLIDHTTHYDEYLSQSYELTEIVVKTKHSTTRYLSASEIAVAIAMEIIRKNKSE